MQIKIVFEGEQLPPSFEEALEQAKSSVTSLDVQIFSAPKGLHYTVPMPLVRFEGAKSVSKEYGNDDGLRLIRAVAAGELQ